ncbi:MAG: transmembrane protein [Parcubacteria group bacterium Gr01-1014_46]|nr:MAG: transmembrane protein [Parcubacteria group bacterium Gr01-1014_46]
MNVDFIFQIIILIFSVVVHEVSHGFAAYRLGDNTAKFAGRLTLNPLNHLEWFGSFILPMLSYFMGGFILGWAKPVPFNPYNLSDQKWGEAKVALAGPLSNIAIAVFFGLLIRFGVLFSLGEAFLYIGTMIVFINLVLATFNLIPIPPLDGSKILFSVLPYSMRGVQEFLERNGIYLMIFFIFFLWQFIVPLVSWEFTLITGLTV